MFEKSINQQMLNFLDILYNILDASQYGFKSKLSTNSTVVRVCERYIYTQKSGTLLKKQCP